MPRSIVLALLAVCLGLLAAGRGASAAPGLVEGDGWRLRLPPGYRPLEQALGQRGEGFARLVSLTTPGDGDFRIFVAGDPSAPEATLVVVRVPEDAHTVGALREAGGLDALEKDLRARLQQAAVPGLELIEVSRSLVGRGVPAVELALRHPGADLAPRLLHTAYVMHDGDLVVLVHDAGDETLAAEAWRGIVTSLRLEDRALLAQLARLAPFLGGGLALLLLLGLALRARRRQRTPYAAVGGAERLGGAGTSAPGGFSRALDGLPTYQGDGPGKEPASGVDEPIRPSPPPPPSRAFTPRPATDDGEEGPRPVPPSAPVRTTAASSGPGGGGPAAPPPGPARPAPRRIEARPRPAPEEGAAPATLPTNVARRLQHHPAALRGEARREAEPAAEAPTDEADGERDAARPPSDEDGPRKARGGLRIQRNADYMRGDDAAR